MRFLGEKTPGGDLDNRKTKHLIYPDVYSQWVDYWRRIAKTSPNLHVELTKTNGGNFNVIPGGEVRDTDDDPAEAIADYLYPLLVSEGGLAEALGSRIGAVDFAMAAFKSAVTDAFRNAEILETSELLVPHPIKRDQLVSGKSTTHEPSYTQDNGALWIMETIDFATPKRTLSKDHAGWAAFMFKDIKENLPSAKPIAIVRLRPADENDSTVRYGMNMLEKTAEEIVNWHDEGQRQSFLKLRIDISAGQAP
jgi:hypothetical protein